MRTELKKWYATAAFVVLVASPSFSADKTVAFDENQAWGYIEDLAQESMLGRKSGHPGGTLAEEYIAAKLREWGVDPAGDAGSYFQSFTFPYWNVEEGTTLEIRSADGRRDFVYGEDWRAQKFSGSGQFTAEIVFVGYGINAPEKGYDDYEGIDARGKLVLFQTGAPQKLVKKLDEKAKMEKKIEAAYELGARGVMVFQPASSTRRLRVRLKKEMYRPEFVVLTADARVTNYIFKELETDLRYPFQQIDENSEPESFDTGVKAYLSLNVEFDAERETRNVLGKISGGGRTMRNEFVIVGGHMDHLGVNVAGEVYNGANDNASGTAVAMELARIMKLGEAKPKRTVIFGFWAAEESGLLGSEHYCDHPTHPIEKTVTYFNMDMVAHGDGTVPFRGEYYGPKVWEVLEAKIPKPILEYTESGRGGPGGSDHSPFLAKGVPAFGVMTGGHHFKYHQVRDDVDLVNPEILKKVGDLVHASIEIMADEEGDFIDKGRYELYHLKVQNLVNFKVSSSSFENVVERAAEIENPEVDLQLSILTEPEGFTGDDLRVALIDQLLAASDKAAEAKKLALYTSSAGFSRTVRDSRITLLPGLNGVGSFADQPAWASVLAKAGASFVMLENSSVLFEGDGLSDKGKELVKAANKGGLLLIVGGTNPAQAKALLSESKKPLVLMTADVPEDDLLDLIKEKDAGLGLLLTKKTDPDEYFSKMETVREKIGTKYLLILNLDCYWKEDGKKAAIGVVSAILGAKYEREDFANVFSATFLRILDEARDVGPKAPPSGRPF
jgi:microsomal dipeptidase-like Zn-dependent dipeptidase